MPKPDRVPTRPLPDKVPAKVLTPPERAALIAELQGKPKKSECIRLLKEQAQGG